MAEHLLLFPQAANSDRCLEHETLDRTAEELEVQQLSRFFSAACRPGPWSANATIDANLSKLNAMDTQNRRKAAQRAENA